MTTSEQILAFYKSLLPPPLPDGIEALLPYHNESVWHLVEQFYHKYYGDTNRRILMIGINPGRLGGGLTGIPFTDPVALESYCGIANELEKKQELSAKFMYKMIENIGGPSKFYAQVCFTAVSPIGFIANGKNFNYYDSNELTSLWLPSMVSWLKHQLASFGRRDVGIIIGTGKNQKFIEQLNDEHQLFEHLVTLPHPRWIMQYRLKSIDNYLSDYQKVFEEYALY